MMMVKPMRKIILCIMLSVLSTSALAEVKNETATVYTVAPGYKYFRLDCERYNYIDTVSYTVSSDKKVITGVDIDGDTFTLINTGCLIRQKQ